ncbi:DDE superfamily endonuclease [Popillia japonica]|uniref:DDE superfamily endonuclease n=1 Tax=Popillia japonica TaxID=7064 RepID=A0AAW1M1J4_POPJA
MIFEQYVQILFKTWYRHLILKHILSQFESSDSINNLTNSISVLDAIYFMKEAWDDVSSDTIKNCLKKTGFREVNDEFESDQFDPEDDILLCKLVQMSTLMREIDNSDLHEFMDIDANLDTEDGNPDNVLLDNFQNESQNSDDEEHETEIPKIDDYEKRIVSYKDGFLEIKKLKQFCSEKNDLHAFGMLSELSLYFEAKLACNTLKQTTILDYFVK